MESLLFEKSMKFGALRPKILAKLVSKNSILSSRLKYCRMGQIVPKLKKIVFLNSGHIPFSSREKILKTFFSKRILTLLFLKKKSYYSMNYLIIK